MLISPNQPSAHNDELRDSILNAENVLFIGAHPDDIEFYCGGMIRMMANNGAHVAFAIATRGGKRLRGWCGRWLEAVRARHQMSAARILGVKDVYLSDLPDGDLPKYTDVFVSKLKSLISEYNPDLVICWDPKFIYNPHPDHQAAAYAARMACRDRRMAYYGTREPNVWVGFDENIYQAKYLSLRAHKTETPWFYWRRISGPLMERLQGEGAKVKMKFAETLRVPANS